ncbi:FtsK/SpoIIIE domain-containing protein [Microbacterium sp. CJ88]|uniref:FtsK/SpoIIIE domain-containing protein n=1 Tax=Microbacterium sp. CJ88 TaxID=3445672 RepID=UPI003F65AA5C
MPRRAARPTASTRSSSGSRSGGRARTADPAPARATVAPPTELSPDDDPIPLPAAWTPPPRPPFPVLASIVPVAGAVGLWMVTGSILSLWLALLGPVIAVATLADGARGARRARRAAVADGARTVAAAEVEIARRHRGERARLRARHPDVAAFLRDGDEIWRAVPGRGGHLVAGAGTRSSEVRVTGGTEDAAAVRLRVRARLLDDAPVTVPLDAGIAVGGPDVLADAVARALVVQLCLSHPPGELQVRGGRDTQGWIDALPHRRVPGGRVVALVGVDEPAPPDVDAVVLRTARGAPAPPACTAVLTVEAPGSARLDYHGEVRELAVEGISLDQAGEIAADLAGRAIVRGHRADDERPVRLADHLPAAGGASRDRDGLRAVIGRHGDGECAVDLVADGPHALVAGVTGSGKSELLITWVLALCAGRSTRDVGVLLADFKGGTAFDALADVPHVTGVITDLDGGGARRAIESLQAEVRWREGELARVGARDIRDPRVELPRLVIVVDEFAALLGAHPELHAVFTDVAARGRALGMHLILGTQRIAGTVRESLLANCPLRISLRVTDAADSRAVIGTDQAALLPGGSAGAGRALVRRAADGMPHPARIALATAGDIAAIAGRDAGPRPRRPWLPALPASVRLDDLDAAPGAIRLGLIDEPEQQRQVTATLALADQGLLVLGGAGTGRSSVLAAIAAQAPGDAVRVPSSGEAAWDAVAALVEHAPAPGSIVLIDDLDALAGALPQEYAVVLLERVERLVRSAGAAGVLVVASMRRLTGPAVRIAELLPRRALLAMPSRAEHIAAGGDGAHHRSDAPPGRGRLDGRAIQFVRVRGGGGVAAVVRPEVDWFPVGPTALVARRSAGLRDVLAAWTDAGATVLSVDDAVRLGEDALATARSPHVVVGAADDWQRRWALLTRLRGDHDLVVDAACAPEYRILTGDRELPPYCSPGASRAWLRTADAAARRIVLPRPQEPERFGT